MPCHTSRHVEDWNNAMASALMRLNGAIALGEAQHWLWGQTGQTRGLTNSSAKSQATVSGAGRR